VPLSALLCVTQWKAGVTLPESTTHRTKLLAAGVESGYCVSLSAGGLISLGQGRGWAEGGPHLPRHCWGSWGQRDGSTAEAPASLCTR